MSDPIISDEEIETVREMCATNRRQDDPEEFWLTLEFVCDEVLDRRAHDSDESRAAHVIARD
jgi:hypothetical protein